MRRASPPARLCALAMLLLCALAMLLLSALTPSLATAGDPSIALRNFELCKTLQAEGDPCAALKACEDGVVILPNRRFRQLRDQVQLECITARERQQTRRKMKLECPHEGQIRTLENEAECCWSGQVWEHDRCVNSPNQCPEGYAVDVERETCSLIPCEDGKVHAEGSPRCCWPEQVWVETQRRCFGTPQCPKGMEARGEVCTVIIPDQDKDSVADSEDACPDQQEDLDGYKDGDGCTDADDDGDRICDPLIAMWGKNDGSLGCRGSDACPHELEDLDGFEDNDGCIDPDNDRDNIPDVKDRCPDQPGPVESRGCPEEIDDPATIVNWAAVGVGVALVGTGLGLHFSAEALRDEVRNPTARRGLVSSITEAEAYATQEKANATDTAALIIASFGGAVLTTGVVLLILDATTSDEDNDADGLSFSVSPSGASLHFRF